LASSYPLETIVILFSLTAGTMLAMWLGQIITQQGIGNGVSIIIFGGIISAMPQNIVNTTCRAASCSCWSS
jgi:preprotein translocase subunit SecY